MRTGTTVGCVVDEDFGWLGVGGEDTGPLGGDRHDIFRLMRLAGQATDLLTAATDTESWRKATGLKALYLVLRPVEAVKQPSMTLASRARKVRTYEVEYDWYGVLGDDGPASGWLLAGHLALVLAALSEQDSIALPDLPAVLPE